MIAAAVIYILGVVGAMMIMVELQKPWKVLIGSVLWPLQVVGIIVFAFYKTIMNDG